VILVAGLVLIVFAVLGAPLFALIAAVALLGFHAGGQEGVAVAVEFYRLADMPALIAIPLFTLAGFLLAESQAPQRLVRLSNALLGWLPGGLAIVAVIACAMFTAFTGATGVTIVALGAVLYPALRHGQFLHGVVLALPGLADIDWFDQSGATLSAEAWNDIGQRTLTLRRAIRLPEGRVTILTLLLNADDRPCDFRLPEPHLPTRVLLDSAAADGACPEPAIIDHQVPVAAHSAVLVLAEHD